MANVVQNLGDNTSKDVKPDFESGKGYYWMKQVREAEAARSRGEEVWLPRKERKGLAENSFFDQVDRRLSRSTHSVNVTFDKDGKIVRS